MKGFDIVSTRTVVKVDFSADDWELFDGPGRDEAATEMSRTLQEAINAEDSTPESVRDAMEAVCSKHGHLGAQDGEPENLIDDVIEKAFPQ